jgi:hypothetical protein
MGSPCVSLVCGQGAWWSRCAYGTGSNGRLVYGGGNSTRMCGGCPQDCQSDEQPLVDGRRPSRYVGRFARVRQCRWVDVAKSTVVFCWASRKPKGRSAWCPHDHRQTPRRRSPSTHRAHDTDRSAGLWGQWCLGGCHYIPNRGMLDRQRAGQADDSHVSLARNPGRALSYAASGTSPATAPDPGSAARIPHTHRPGQVLA